MGVRLRCTDCGRLTMSALFYRGQGHHLCRDCGSRLVLAEPADERRSAADRRATDLSGHWDDMRTGVERRQGQAPS